MKILIMSVNLRYDDEDITQADVRFRGYTENINVNGDFTLTASEYEGNESTENLVAIARQRLESGLANE